MGAHKTSIWIIAVQLGYTSTKDISLIHQLSTAHVTLKSRYMSLVNSEQYESCNFHGTPNSCMFQGCSKSFVFYVPLSGKVSVHSANVLCVNVINLTTLDTRGSFFAEGAFWLQHLADISCLACI